MRILIAGLSLISILLVGALVAPQFVDWNKYKPQITTQVEKATGLNVTIGGDLSMSVLPMPHVKIEDLVIASPNSKEFDNLLTMKSVDVSVELLPLLQKEIKVSSVTLIEPNINIEILENGTPSWETEKLKRGADKNETLPEEEKQNPQTQISSTNKLESIALDKLEIQGGKIIFVNHGTKARYDVSSVNTTIKASSLSGPFSGKGDMVYNNSKIGFDIETEKLPEESALPVKATITVTDAGAEISFNGVTALSGAIDVQGQTSIKTKSIGGLLAVVSGQNNESLNQDLGIEGLISANDNTIKFDNLKISTSDFTGNGKISVQNLKAKNPLLITGDIKSSNVLNLNPFLNTSSDNKATDKKSSSEQSSKAKNKDIVPSSLTLPMDINTNFKLDVAGLRFQKYNLRGVAVDLDKKGKAIKTSFNVSEMPGQAKAAGALLINYASSSQSQKTGQVTYSDPTIKYTVDGKIGQLAAFLTEFAPDVDAKAITKNYNSATFDLDGTFNGGAIQLNDSALKLDDLVVGLNGNYKPATSTSRAAAVIEARADAVDLDKFTGGTKKTASNDNGSSDTKAPSIDKSDALKPLQELSLPLDLDFDISVQKLRIGGKDLSGLRADGKILPNKLTLDTLSVNDYAGAALSAKGVIANLKELSGLDITAYIKTDDLKSFANTMNIDVSKLPASVNKLEASVEGKGIINNLSFASNVKALGGSLDASGIVNNTLKTPEFSDLAVRVIHPNANNAIQAVSPDFKASDALNQAIDFYAKVNSSGKIYNLSGMKAKLGTSDFTGDLQIDMSNKITAVSGDINAGRLALDSLLGAKSAGGKSTSGGGTTSGSSSGGKWSDKPINLSWMNNNNINVNFSAENLTYEKWNFSNPSTSLKISNGVMKVSDMKAGVFGGNATVNTTVNANPLSIDLSSNMSGIDIEKLASALSNSNKLKANGDVSFTVDVKGTGNSSRALVSNLNGTSKVNGKNISIQGFDLAKIAQGLNTEQKFASSLQNFAGGALQGGETRFDTLVGDYAIQNGIVNISEMILDGPSAMINSTGQADLPKWYINVVNMISLKNVEDFEPVKIEIKGDISNSSIYGKNILQDYLQQKLQRKLGKELPDLLGDDVTEKLQQFGIVPGVDGATQAPTVEGILNGLIKPKKDPAPAKPAPVIVPEKAVEPAPAEVQKMPEVKTEAEPVTSDEPTPEPAAEPDPEPTPVQEVAPTPEPEPETNAVPQNPEDVVNDLIQGLF